MTGQNIDKNVWGINHQQARFLLEELVRNGIDTFVVSTGSRNTALMVALADFENVRVLVHPDERGAAFYALGYARGSGKPAALICTSGTAAANYYPAIIEASQAQIPMLILTADRPIEVRDSLTDQVIDQVNLYGKYLRWSFDLPAPKTSILPDYLFTTIDQAVFRATTSPAGPVHLNCCFGKPHVTPPEDKQWYTDSDKLKSWRDSEKPFTTYALPRLGVPESERSAVVELLGKSKRGLIVCGGLPAHGNRDAIVLLAKKLGWPILADITSGLRFGLKTKDDNPVCAHSELYLRDKELAEHFRPDVILHFGAGVVNESLQEFLKNTAAECVLVANHPFRQDPTRIVSFRVQSDPFEFAKVLETVVEPAPSALYPIMTRADAGCEELLVSLSNPAARRSGWPIALEITREIDGESALFLGNSLPVREMDRFALKSEKAISVACNRGTSGIDGNLATAAGIAAGQNRPLTVFTGDVALIHDLNSLLFLKRSKQPITLVVPNNDGGGIFPFLPTVTETKRFEELFVAPHGLQFTQAAEMFGLPYYRAETVGEFRDAYRKALSLQRSAIVEVSVDRTQNVREQRELFEKASRLVKQQVVVGDTDA